MRTPESMATSDRGWAGRTRLPFATQAQDMLHSTPTGISKASWIKATHNPCLLQSPLHIFEGGGVTHTVSWCSASFLQASCLPQ